MDHLTPLKSALLRRACDLSDLAFETTETLEPLLGTIGQSRALEALEMGLGLRRDGYNIFVAGLTGVGKHTVARDRIDRLAKDEPVPSDWCYVMNFEEAHKPRALRLPAGQGCILERAMDRVVDDVRSTLPAVFTSDRYATRVRAINEAMEKVQAQALEALEATAGKRGLSLLREDGGYSFVALNPNGEGTLEGEGFDSLPDEQKKPLQAALDEMEGQLQALASGIPRWRKETRDRIRTLEEEFTRTEVDRIIEPLRVRFADQEAVLTYLTAVAEDFVEQLEIFRGDDDEDGDSQVPRKHPILARYGVNLLVDHSDSKGAPVIYQDNPVYANLIGRIEHTAEYGALLTNHTLIQPGALHRASGGYLIVDARRLLRTPHVWDVLKRTLRSGLLRLDSPSQQTNLLSTVSLRPEPIPVDVKVILLGTPGLYYELSSQDEDFERHFKVLAWFEGRIPRNSTNAHQLARMIASKASQNGLRPFDKSAVERIIEQSARDVEDSEFLSADLSRLFNLMDEADYWAGQAKHDAVKDEDVGQALAAWVRRSSRPRDNYHHAIERGTLSVATDGEIVGQINGLAVVSIGNFEFGRPSRITATARMGHGELVDIERESHLGGSLHVKGVMILQSLLRSRFALDVPMSVSASLVFEQSYGLIDGDSASMAEYITLMSAIARVPILQSRAITGSLNQLGRAQAIGGVNAKIEGFYDICAARGLTGDQGVVIPRTNIPNLMLRRDVSEAAEAGRFHVWTVDSVDEAAQLMTGLAMGIRDERGAFPEGSLGAKVEARLREFYAARRRVQDPDLIHS
ncbi:MAG: putative ATP-dependent protease [Myxococcota bacterium]|jgi:predicted ATP-dependent protease